MQPTDAGMSRPWSVTVTLAVAQDRLIGRLVDRRHFRVVSVNALSSAVSACLVNEAPVAAARWRGHQDDDLIIGQIEAAIPQLQQLDDAKGGAASLGYVGAQLRAVALVLHEGQYSAAATRRLPVGLADLGQRAGWRSTRISTGLRNDTSSLA